MPGINFIETRERLARRLGQRNVGIGELPHFIETHGTIVVHIKHRHGGGNIIPVASDNLKSHEADLLGALSARDKVTLTTFRIETVTFLSGRKKKHLHIDRTYVLTN